MQKPRLLRRPFLGMSPIAAVFSMAVLTACGGGSGSSEASPPPVATTPPPTGASSPTTPTTPETPSTPTTPTTPSTPTTPTVPPTPETPTTTPVPTPVPPAGTDDPQTVATFTATDAELPNPERGFYRWTWANLDTFTRADADDAYKAGYRLLFSKLDLSAYRGSDLTPALLAQVETALDHARAAGVKLVIRVVYNYPESEVDYQNAKDAPLSRVLAHITQFKPVLQRNADVIAFMQAGFIGAWGEWHTSSNNLTAAASRNQIRDALLAALPASRFIQLRYPPYVMDGTPTLPTLSAVLTGSLRVGVHNDCFLASKTDVGTYDDNTATATKQRDYVDRLGDLAPFGGETCNPADEAGAVPRSQCADILGEGARYNLTYLNDEYYRTAFHDKWVQGGCMAEVRRKMGYRLALVKVSHAVSVARGQALSVRLDLRNDGWARVFNPRGVQLVLKNATSGEVRRIDASGADPRTWLPGGVDQAATLAASVPADLPAGRYQVSVALPDGDARLATDARFAIRWANADNAASGQRWDATLGAFSLGTVVDVK
ncbi:DUF4832 domain-containing protein [Roseateles chitinivorans]|uniref:DUF4832 domain-containing protein n=1 Tax=Roseateles chitinivorans TaxID=2917965 RepID=UPI003D666F23